MRTFVQRQQDILGVERGARLVGIEEIERQRRVESQLRAEIADLKAENEDLYNEIRFLLETEDLGDG
jgi:cell division protein FtsB